MYGNTLRAEARDGLVYGPYLNGVPSASIATAVGATCTKLRRRFAQPRGGRPVPRRGLVREFSRRSRTRLQQTLCSVPVAHVGRGMLFITLTYPAAYPGDWQLWKAQLHHMAIKFARRFPRFGAVWKLEPQRRGAPHFHLLVVGVPYVAKGWLSQTWYEVVGSHDLRHLAAGTNVQLARSHRGVVSYASKYAAKRQALPEDWQGGVGRWWGVLGRANLGIVWRWAPLTQPQYFQAVRLVRSLVAHRRPRHARAPPLAAPSGTWAVLADWQALRIARCVRDSDRIGPREANHEYSARPARGADCRVRSQ